MKWTWQCLVVLFFASFLLHTGEVSAQSEPWPPYRIIDVDDEHTIYRGPGGYLAWWKLLLIGITFVGWIKLADWLNRDTIRHQAQHGMRPEIWNPIMVGSFLIGLFGAVVNIPYFLIGFPVFLLAACGPFIVYLLMRRGKIEKGNAETHSEGATALESIVSDNIYSLISVEPAGSTPEQQQSNLIRARQSPTYPLTLQMLYDAAYRRGEVLIMDFTREQVTRKIQIDGVWHELPVLDRVTADAMLASLKYLANLNPADRRGRQEGRFASKARRLELINHLVTQGTPNGERAIIKFGTRKKQPLEITRLGMWPDAYAKFSEALNDKGYSIISAPPTQGLSTTWQAVLHATDRFVRDWISIVDQDESDSEMENIECTRFDSKKGESPSDPLPRLLLKQPAGIVVPNPVNAESVAALAIQVCDFDRTVISRLHAKSAVEAVLRFVALSGQHRERFVKSLSVAICQRLARRLCDSCKQPLPVNPELIRQLGGDPKNPPTLYTHFQLPPPEQRVDETGQPIEFPPCETCGGIGYIGRIAIFETLYLNNAIRKAILAEPKIDSVSKVAREQGHLSLPQEAYRLVLEGITSLAEVQRIMKN